MLTRFFRRSYKQVATLSGPRDAIQSVSFSADGAFVSASGYGGITIWDMQTFKAVPTPHLPYEPKEAKHVYSSSTWLYFEANDTHVFVAGSMAGELSLWSKDKRQNTFRASGRQSVAQNGAQVMSIDVSDTKVASGNQARLVTSSSDRVVTLWTITSTLELTSIVQVTLPEDFLPRIVKFARGTHNVYAFSKFGGSFLQLQASTGDFSWVKKNGPKEMHFVSVDESNDVFAAWTGQHAELLKLSNSERIMTFKGEAPLVGNTKQVAFAEEGNTLMVGTDHGFVEVFSVQSGECIQRLEYPRKALVQYVNTYTLPSCHFVAVAGSTRDQPADLVVFRKKYNAPRIPSSVEGRSDENLICSVSVTWTGVRWIGIAVIFLMMGYSMLSRYSQAFIWSAEGSVYPLGLGVQFFVYVPALSRFASPHAVSSAPGPEIVTATKASEFYPTVTVTEQSFSVVTERYPVHSISLVTERYPVSVTVTVPTTVTIISTTTVTEKLPAATDSGYSSSLDVTIISTTPVIEKLPTTDSGYSSSSSLAATVPNDVVM